MNFDLHCHSTASDGDLTPKELMRFAHQCEVDCMAITDHDCIDGLAQARQEAENLPVRLINGIEISCLWQNKTIHVVGLNIDPDNTDLSELIDNSKQYRLLRAQQIASDLEKYLNKYNVLEGVSKFISGNIPGRLHFAKWLVAEGHAKNIKAVFKRFLIKGKPGYIRSQWPELMTAVKTIVKANGIAVLAHPKLYKISSGKLNQLIKDFKAYGGKGIEVVYGYPIKKDEISHLAMLAEKHQLYASMGSDFHGNNADYYQKLGLNTTLPSNCKPVWELF